MKLLRIEVDNTMLEDGPRYGRRPRYTYYLIYTRVYQSGGKKKPKLIRRRGVRTLEGNTRDEIGEHLRAVFDEPKWELVA